MEDTFCLRSWYNFGKETIKDDEASIGWDHHELALDFSKVMEKIYENDKIFESPLWATVNPIGTEDRTWVRVYLQLKGNKKYDKIYTSYDGHHACHCRRRMIWHIESGENNLN